MRGALSQKAPPLAGEPLGASYKLIHINNGDAQRPQIFTVYYSYLLPHIHLFKRKVAAAEQHVRT